LTPEPPFARSDGFGGVGSSGGLGGWHDNGEGSNDVINDADVDAYYGEGVDGSGSARGGDGREGRSSRDRGSGDGGCCEGRDGDSSDGIGGHAYDPTAASQSYNEWFKDSYSPLARQTRQTRRATCRAFVCELSKEIHKVNASTDERLRSRLRSRFESLGSRGRC
jgi:hypothetical protein